MAAQNVLLVQHGDVFTTVVSARETHPSIIVDGKVTQVPGDRYALHSIEEYTPVFISVQNLTVASKGLMLADSGSEINHDLVFNADFESPYRLDDVFLVLELNTEAAGKVLFLWGLGTITPHEPVPVSLTVPLTSRLGAGKSLLHLFVGGREAFHSQMPFDYREAKLDQMVAKRITGRPDGGPAPLVGPAPEYPEALKKAKVEGEAMITIHITERGTVTEPVIKSASDPAFGESALVAVRQWRFLPKIKQGQPVETTVNMPFVFKL